MILLRNDEIIIVEGLHTHVTFCDEKPYIKVICDVVVESGIATVTFAGFVEVATLEKILGAEYIGEL